jgi:exosome complex exonuclease RRP6
VLLGGAQLSTRTQDFIVDTLAVRARVPELNDAFTNPRIVKVLHGCSSDVLWLQRDFGVYLVNVFDTGEASKMLHYPSHGLAHLLQTFCGVTADKKYQVCFLCACMCTCVQL